MITISKPIVVSVHDNCPEYKDLVSVSPKLDAVLVGEIEKEKGFLEHTTRILFSSLHGSRLVETVLKVKVHIFMLIRSIVNIFRGVQQLFVPKVSKKRKIKKKD